MRLRLCLFLCLIVFSFLFPPILSLPLMIVFRFKFYFRNIKFYLIRVSSFSLIPVSTSMRTRALCGAIILAPMDLAPLRHCICGQQSMWAILIRLSLLKASGIVKVSLTSFLIPFSNRFSCNTLKLFLLGLLSVSSTSSSYPSIYVHRFVWLMPG